MLIAVIIRKIILPALPAQAPLLTQAVILLQAIRIKIVVRIRTIPLLLQVAVANRAVNQAATIVTAAKLNHQPNLQLNNQAAKKNKK